MGYGNTKDLKPETKNFQQKINQYHTIQLTFKKEYYDTIFKQAKTLNMKFDDYIIFCSLLNTDFDSALDFVESLNYKADKERLYRLIKYITTFL